MRKFEKLIKTWSDGALVFVNPDEDVQVQMIRPAAFVFLKTGGLIWVEPSYADPYGASSPAIHSREGQLSEAPNGFQINMADGQRMIFLPYMDDADLVGDSLAWFASHLASKQTTWQAERHRVRKRLARELTT